MINLLFLLATAQAADVYDVCVVEKQTWSDQYQKFETIAAETFYTYQGPRLIVYENSFELDRVHRPIIETTKKDGMTCWREHANSEICYDKGNNRMFWEWNTRAGATLRDVLKICSRNGG